MNKDDMLKLLKKSDSRFKNARLPRDIKLNYDEGARAVCLFVAKPWDNMQSDAAAFEGWVLALKASPLGKDIKTFHLAWDKYTGNKKPERMAYGRFLYRVREFLNNFSSLMEVPADFKKEYANAFESTQPWYINTADQKADRTTLHAIKKGCERWVERKMVAGLGEKFVVFGNQFPVGVFKRKVSKETQIMSSSAAAIDLWGIDKKNTAHIFELKIGANKKVGIISEILFYTSIIAKLQTGGLRFEADNTQAKALAASKGVKAHLLVPRNCLHPLITGEVMKLMNRHFKQAGISFDVVEYVNRGDGFAWSL